MSELRVEDVKIGDLLIWIENKSSFKVGDIVKVYKVEYNEEIVHIHNQQSRDHGFFAYRFKKATEAEVVLAKLLDKYLVCKCPKCSKIVTKKEKNMNRIRYEKNGNRLESVKTFNHPNNGARYRVLLDESNSSWYVVDAEGGAVALTGQETSFHKVKKAAKAGLESLGIEFSAEARTKRVSHLHLVTGTKDVPETEVSGEELG